MDERQEFAPQTSSHVLEKIEAVLQGKENELRQLDTYHEQLAREHNERIEFNEVLSKTLQFFKEFGPNDLGGNTDLLSASAAPINASAAFGQGGGYGTRVDQMKFAMLTGVVESDVRNKFERMLFRITRGNCFIRFDPIDDLIVDPETAEKMKKEVFSIFYKSETIERKLKKVCDAFKAKTYELDSQKPADITRKILDNESDLKESAEVLRINRVSCVRICDDIAYRQHTWRRLVRHEKIIYHTMNLLKTEVSGMLQGDAWVVKEKLPDVKKMVADAHGGENSGGMPCVVNILPSPWPEPPTHFMLNPVTIVFQKLVDTYGIPRYQEINPAVFTTVTFPFLFGVMFGDVGHGSCVLLGGIYLVATGAGSENTDHGELMNGLYLGRYMIFLMGVFAVYCGLIYNDYFAVSLNLFGSKWRWQEEEECTKMNLTPAQCANAVPLDGMDPTKGDVYAFGTPTSLGSLAPPFASTPGVSSLRMPHLLLSLHPSSHSLVSYLCSLACLLYRHRPAVARSLERPALLQFFQDETFRYSGHHPNGCRHYPQRLQRHPHKGVARLHVRGDTDDGVLMLSIRLLDHPHPRQVEH
jgi:V-type H+-transporting ATPase subunit a